MLRRRIDLLLASHLDDAPEVHHHDPVGDMADHCEIVGDEQIREVFLFLQVLQQVDDLRLNGNVKRRNRFVCNDKARINGNGPGDTNALALSAGELPRVAIHDSWATGRPRSRSSATRSRFFVRLRTMPKAWRGSAMMSAMLRRGLSDP